MAMTTGRARGGQQSDINMTPMIDVLLVLLIIFMVVQQGLQRGVSVQVPPATPSGHVQPAEQMVLTVRPGPEYALNAQPIPAARLTQMLQAVFAPRPRKVLFVDAAETLRYGEVIHAVDASRAAGVQVVGLVPRKAAGS
jgi:biopolymer transport protein TolR